MAFLTSKGHHGKLHYEAVQLLTELIVKLRYHIALVHVQHVMSPAKGYICCATSGREIMDVWTKVTVRVVEGYKFLAPKVSYIINHENNTFYSSGRGERKKKRKKKKRKKVYKTQSYHGISL